MAKLKRLGVLSLCLAFVMEGWGGCWRGRCGDAVWGWKVGGRWGWGCDERGGNVVGGGEGCIEPEWKMG